VSASRLYLQHCNGNGGKVVEKLISGTVLQIKPQKYMSQDFKVAKLKEKRLSGAMESLQL
jgi:hypothetical protein